MHHFTTTLLCILSALSLAALANAGLSLFHRYGHPDAYRRNREVAGILFGAVGLIYSLILAFVVVAVWNDYEELNGTVEKESDKLAFIVDRTTMLPDSVGRPLRRDVAAYTTEATGKEWGSDKVMNPGSITAMYRLCMRQDGLSLSTQKILDGIGSDLRAILELRRERLGHTRSHVPAAVWVMLVAGAIILLVFTFYFSTEQPRLQRIWITLFSFVMGLSLFLVYLLDHPFTFDGVSKAPYEEVIRLAGP